MTPALARLRQVARPPRLAAGWRRAMPRLLMAALGALALAKLGLLAEDLLGRLGTGPQPVVEAGPIAPGVQPTSVAAAGSEPEAPMPAAGPDPPAPPSTPGPSPQAAPASPAATALPTGALAAAPPGAGAATPPEPLADSSAAPDSSLDPSRLTASEIAILQQLAARGSALDQRARELDRKSALLETAAAGLEGQIAQLSELRTRIAAAIEQHDAAEDAKLKSLIKIYETMKPKAAAEIFDRLEMPVLLRVVGGMREAKAADVLARMDPARAKQVTTELAKHTRLLEAPQPGPAAMATTPPANGG